MACSVEDTRTRIDDYVAFLHRDGVMFVPVLQLILDECLRQIVSATRWLFIKSVQHARNKN